MGRFQSPASHAGERVARGPTGRLALVMGLPLIDGLFPAIVLAGGLDDPGGILEVGLLVFGGSATLAVILADTDGTVRSQVRSVMVVGVPLVALAAIEAALAPTLSTVLDLVLFERFAAVVVLAVAARTASARIGEYLPNPGVVVSLGLLASIDPRGASLGVYLDPGLIASAAAAAGVGVVVALVAASLAPWLREAVDVDRVRFGSAVALGVLPLGLFGVVPGDAPLSLAVLCLTALFAFDPSGATDPDLQSGPDRIGTAPMADRRADIDDGHPPTSETDVDRRPWL